VISIFANEPVIEVSPIVSFVISWYATEPVKLEKFATFPFESTNGLSIIKSVSFKTSTIVAVCTMLVLEPDVIVITFSSTSTSNVPEVLCNK